jgi:hypothetical protein
MNHEEPIINVKSNALSIGVFIASSHQIAELTLHAQRFGLRM